MLSVGSTLTFSADIYDKDPQSGGVPANAQTVTLSVTLPDGSMVTPTVLNPPTIIGKYRHDYSSTAMAGTYKGFWTFVMTGGKTATYYQQFEISSADPGTLISLFDAKKHLNIPVSDTSQDDEILDWVSAVTRVIENRVGACIPRTVVDYVEGNARVLRTETQPVLSVTSIVPYLTSGTIYAPAQIRVTSTGRIMLLTGLYFSYGPYEITYVAGRRPIPPNIRAAAKIILGHLWETQRGSAGLPLQMQDEDATYVPGFGFAVPSRALELLGPDDEGPAVG